MLLEGYSKEMFRPKCNPSFQSVHCVAHLDEDVSPALPYLNSVLGGETFVKDPPSVTLRMHGKLITVHAREIFINALRDEEEAESVLAWLKHEINDAWAKREEIQPSFEGANHPKMMDILKLLPRTNCRECGEPTCTVFAVRVAEGARDIEDCSPLSADARAQVGHYLGAFIR